jgi:hypothetical protein
MDLDRVEELMVQLEQVESRHARELEGDPDLALDPQLPDVQASLKVAMTALQRTRSRLLVTYLQRQAA